MMNTMNMINDYMDLLACCIGSSNLNAANKYAALAAPRIHSEVEFVTAMLSFLFITPKGRSIISELYKEIFKMVLGLIAMIPGAKMVMLVLYKMGIGYLVWERRGCIKVGEYAKYKGMYHGYILFLIARVKKTTKNA